MKSIHNSSIISPSAIIEDGVVINAFSVIGQNVKICKNTIIESFCQIGIETPLTNGAGLTIGHSSHIRSHSIIYNNNFLGDHLTTGHHVTVRENSSIGNNCQIGSYSELQGDCFLGNHVKMQSGVFIPKATTLKDYVRISPHVHFTNDPTPPSEILMGVTVEEFACIAASATILPGITVGKCSLVAAHSCVTRDVEPYTVVQGVPARKIGYANKIKLKGVGKPAYPWPFHFRRGYPDTILEDLSNLHQHD